MKNSKKKMNFIGALAFAFAIVAAFAFTPSTEDVGKEVDNVYYFEWDGTSTGSYIPIQNVCADPDGEPCAMGFIEQDVNTSVNPPVLKSYAQLTPRSHGIDERLVEE